jgi:hypothetical protein
MQRLSRGQAEYEFMAIARFAYLSHKAIQLLCEMARKNHDQGQFSIDRFGHVGMVPR